MKIIIANAQVPFITGREENLQMVTLPPFTEHFELEVPDYSSPLYHTVLQTHPV